MFDSDLRLLKLGKRQEKCKSPDLKKSKLYINSDSIYYPKNEPNSISCLYKDLKTKQESPRQERGLGSIEVICWDHGKKNKLINFEYSCEQKTSSFSNPKNSLNLHLDDFKNQDKEDLTGEICKISISLKKSREKGLGCELQFDTRASSEVESKIDFEKELHSWRAGKGVHIFKLNLNNFSNKNETKSGQILKKNKINYKRNCSSELTLLSSVKPFCKRGKFTFCNFYFRFLKEKYKKILIFRVQFFFLEYHS